MSDQPSPSQEFRACGVDKGFAATPLRRRRRVPAVLLSTVATLLIVSGCSVKKFAVNKLGDSLANSGTTFASDNDPEFVGQAVPFSLKLIEGLLAESPKHRGLLFAAASGFTQYSYSTRNIPDSRGPCAGSRSPQCARRRSATSRCSIGPRFPGALRFLFPRTIPNWWLNSRKWKR